MPIEPIALSQRQRVFFRDELRQARGAALLNSEGYEPIIVALERLGRFLNPKGNGFGSYRDPLLQIAHEGRFGRRDRGDSEVFSDFDPLYHRVNAGRNDAVHEGAHARHLVRHCVELALGVEDGLRANSKTVEDFMVRFPACAEAWQPIAFARQQMLINSFSYLPIHWEGVWHVVSDKAIAQFVNSQNRPSKALMKTFKQVVGVGELVLEPAHCVRPEASVQEIVRDTNGSVILITSTDDSLLGIATFFDFL